MAALANIHIGFALGMYISCCLSWIPNANTVSGGIGLYSFVQNVLHLSPRHCFLFGCQSL